MCAGGEGEGHCCPAWAVVPNQRGWAASSAALPTSPSSRTLWMLLSLCSQQVKCCFVCLFFKKKTVLLKQGWAASNKPHPQPALIYQLSVRKQISRQDSITIRHKWVFLKGRTLPPWGDLSHHIPFLPPSLPPALAVILAHFLQLCPRH